MSVSGFTTMRAFLHSKSLARVRLAPFDMMYRASSVTFFLLITAVFGRSEFAAAGDSEAKAQLQERDLFAAFYYPWYVAEGWENDWV